MFHGVRPPAQPRTLRTIAEDKGTTPMSRADAINYDMIPSTGYHEPGEGLGASASNTIKNNAADPSPFANLRGSK